MFLPQEEATHEVFLLVFQRGHKEQNSGEINSEQLLRMKIGVPKVECLNFLEKGGAVVSKVPRVRNIKAYPLRYWILWDDDLISLRFGVIKLFRCCYRGEWREN